jgi:hypothetical protein
MLRRGSNCSKVVMKQGNDRGARRQAIAVGLGQLEALVSSTVFPETHRKVLELVGDRSVSGRSEASPVKPFADAPTGRKRPSES